MKPLTGGSQSLAAIKKSVKRVKKEVKIVSPKTWADKTIRGIKSRDLRITIKETTLLKTVAPPYLWRCDGYRFDPLPFALENDSLNAKLKDPRLQWESLDRWIEDPSDPIIYSVTSAPDDSRALVFASMLVNLHQHLLGSDAQVYWDRVYSGFDNRLMEKDLSVIRPTLLVISNINVDSTKPKLEKARDLLDKFSHVPRIIIGAGTDPISMASVLLRSEVHSIAYLPSALAKPKIEII